MNNNYLNDLLTTKKELLKQKKNYNFTYKPLPLDVYPTENTGAIKPITITPIGIIPSNADNENVLDDVMYKLPTLHSPASCILQGLNLRTQYATITGTINDVFNNSSKAGKKTLTYKQIKTTDQAIMKTYKKKIIEQTDIPGLQFLIGGFNSTPSEKENIGFSGSIKINTETYMNNFLNTTTNPILPTKFDSIQSATTTNASGKNFYYSKDVNSKYVVQWWGYFIPNVTGNWTFKTTSDDYSYVWVGDTANLSTNVNTLSNAIVKNKNQHGMKVSVSSSEIYFIKGQKYPIKIQFSEGIGGDNFVLEAKSNTGSYTSNFTNMFYSTISKEIEKEVTEQVGTETKTENIGGTRTVDTTNAYNKGFTTTDANPVIISLKKHPDYDNKTSSDDYENIYNCYINKQDSISQGKLKSILKDAGDRTVYNDIIIMQGLKRSDDVYNGYCYLDEGALLKLDNGKEPTFAIEQISASKAESIKLFIEPYDNYLYIAEETDSNNYIIPQIYFKNTKNKNVGRLQIEYSEDYINLKTYKKYQKPNETWLYEQGRYLVYDPLFNKTNNKETGYIYKLTNTDPIFSPSGLFRLIMIDGALTLQMSVYATDKTTKKTNYIPISSLNNFNLMKLDLNNQLGQVNMYDISNNKTYFVPSNYTIYGSTYTTYNNTFPYINTDTVTFEGDATKCKQECSNDVNCQAVYSFKDGSKNICKKQKERDVIDPTFNPVSNNSSIKTSSLYIKNREIDPQYNNPFYNNEDISFVVLQNNPIFTNETYYPDYPNHNVNNRNTLNGYDILKNDLIEKNDKIIQFMNNNVNSSYDINNYFNVGVEEFISNRNLYNKNNIEEYMNLSNTDLDNKCNNLTDTSKTQACIMKNKIYEANTKGNTLEQNNNVLYSNYNTIVSTIDDIDKKFKEMSTIPTVGNNVYNADFNDFQSDEDNTLLTAIHKDTNEILLNYNAMYIIGTIATASLLILAIIIAKK